MTALQYQRGHRKRNVASFSRSSVFMRAIFSVCALAAISILLASDCTRCSAVSYLMSN
eukprot:m.219731 g.219731  ORF g.219731 m.219731 type:complete len:58 (+) comp54136_c0_seq8:131-304(+)